MQNRWSYPACIQLKDEIYEAYFRKLFNSSLILIMNDILRLCKREIIHQIESELIHRALILILISYLDI